ncbi:TPA: nuclease PIN [Escherichia coli]|nr:nuclease PIN [Escherichia coli]
MNRATIGFYLAVVLGSCSMNCVSQADELLTWDDFFVADESRHQWVNEHNGRTGALNVKGALVSSPCILDTPEVKVPLQKDKGQYVLNLKVSRCGDGRTDIPEHQSTEYGDIVVKQSAVLKTGKDEMLLSVWRKRGVSRKNLQHGDNQITYYLNEAQYQKIVKTQIPITEHEISDSNRGILHLNIMYE